MRQHAAGRVERKVSELLHVREDLLDEAACGFRPVEGDIVGDDIKVCDRETASEGLIWFPGLTGGVEFMQNVECDGGTCRTHRTKTRRQSMGGQKDEKRAGKWAVLQVCSRGEDLRR